MTDLLTQEVIERVRLLRDEHSKDSDGPCGECGNSGVTEGGYACDCEWCAECADGGNITRWPCQEYRELGTILAVLEAAQRIAKANEAYAKSQVDGDLRELQNAGYALLALISVEVPE